ncbi:uncharacterized protein LOC112129422 isoform X3 [Pongo abelii]|uniref:uncharacterized protein LOC112129422 isoform X3 n=1 Tax=Pongo abelii TaxID=9601 RepID=UPI0023E8F733|nr:uncharacterized protein LOC112129422 isoform X3 [Pongo abelii]
MKGARRRPEAEGRGYRDRDGEGQVSLESSQHHTNPRPALPPTLQMLWLLFLTLPRLGVSVPVFPAPLPPAPHLQEAEVPIVRTRACERMYHKGPAAHGQGAIIKADMLCAGKKGQGFCQGDAGTSRSVTGWTPGSRLAC